jgi:hypothetical protein
MSLSPEEMEDTLKEHFHEIVYEVAEEDHFVGPIKDVQSFRELGLMTTDNGISLSLADGSEWLLTIKRYR